MSPRRARPQIRTLTLMIASCAVGVINSERRDDDDDSFTLEPRGGAEDPKTTKDLNSWATNGIKKANEIMEQTETMMKVTKKLRRPDHDQVTNISFGIMLIRFNYLDVRQKTFTADVVWSMRWHDPRGKRFLQPGQKEFTMPFDCHNDHLWRPRMRVTNFQENGRGMEQFKVTDDEMVSFTRSLSGQFSFPSSIVDYPFDIQKPQIELASNLYMANELELQPVTDTKDSYFSKVEAKAFDHAPFRMVNSHVTAGVQKAGPMRRSKAKFVFEVNRSLSSWYRGHLTSMLLLVLMGYTCWWFPLTAPFAMPRVATSTMSYLTMSQTRHTYLQTLQMAEISWGEYYIQNFIWLQMLSIVLNVLVEYVAWSLKLVDLASKLNAEIRVLYLVLAVVSYMITGENEIRWCGPAFQIAVTVVYFVVAMSRVIHASTGSLWCCSDFINDEETEKRMAEMPESSTVEERNTAPAASSS